ncbi:MAG: hypothetical protein V4754_18825 [Pseudomonadota bacterium]
MQTKIESLWGLLVPHVTSRSATVTLLLIVFAVAWWEGSNRSPTEIAFCVNGGIPGMNYKCRGTVTLSIPAIYYAGYPLDYSRHMAQDGQHLEVAYPSMQPWHSLYWWNKWQMHKIEIEIHSFANSRPKEGFQIFSRSLTVLAHKSEPLYGLDNYVLKNSWMGQLLLPLELNPRVFIRCAYNGNVEDDGNLGCLNETLISSNKLQPVGFSPASTWGMSVKYMHKRALLPRWVDLHTKVETLVQSFVTSP